RAARRGGGGYPRGTDRLRPHELGEPCRGWLDLVAAAGERDLPHWLALVRRIGRTNRSGRGGGLVGMAFEAAPSPDDRAPHGRRRSACDAAGGCPRVRDGVGGA